MKMVNSYFVLLTTDVIADPANKTIIHRPNADAQTPLHLVVFNGMQYFDPNFHFRLHWKWITDELEGLEIAELLIQNCAYLNAKERGYGRTPLHYAANKGNSWQHHTTLIIRIGQTSMVARVKWRITIFRLSNSKRTWIFLEWFVILRQLPDTLTLFAS